MVAEAVREPNDPVRDSQAIDIWVDPILVADVERELPKAGLDDPLTGAIVASQVESFADRFVEWHGSDSGA